MPVLSLTEISARRMGMSEDHLAKQPPTLGVVADRGDGGFVKAVMDERGEPADVVVDTERGVAGVGHRSGPLHDALQDSVTVVGPSQFEGNAEQYHS